MGAERSPYPPQQPMVSCPHCGARNEGDRAKCRNCHKPMAVAATQLYCRCGNTLHTKHCLAALFGCEPQAIVRMAWLKRWPSTRVLGQYKFTDAMVAQIIGENSRWPQNEPVQEPKQPKQAQPRARRVASPQPAPARSNVRKLVAKPRRSA